MSSGDPSLLEEARTAFDAGASRVRGPELIPDPLETPNYPRRIPFAHEATRAALPSTQQELDEEESNRQRRRRTKRFHRQARKQVYREKKERFAAKAQRRQKARDEQQEKWRKQLRERGHDDPNPYVANSKQRDTAAYVLSWIKHAPKHVLARLPPVLAEAYVQGVMSHNGMGSLEELTEEHFEQLDGLLCGSGSRTNRVRLGGLVGIFEGSFACRRDGYDRVATGMSQNYIAGMLPKDWDGTYKLRWLQQAIRWLKAHDVLLPHQPPPSGWYEERNQPDPLPRWHRGPTGNAYNQYWFKRGSGVRAAAKPEERARQYSSPVLAKYLLELDELPPKPADVSDEELETIVEELLKQERERVEQGEEEAEPGMAQQEASSPPERPPDRLH